jgi:ribosomal-protein-serine acetyltransferase
MQERIGSPREMIGFRALVDAEIELVVLEPRHAPELFRATDRNRVHLRRWLPWLDATTSIGDTVAFIESTRRQASANNGFQSGIWYRHELVGVIGFHQVDWPNRTTSIGYWLAQPFEGRGIMTRACGALVSHGFRQMRLHRLEVRCAVANARSRAIPERLGFRLEGTIREAEWLYDRFVDHAVYGLLEAEWR